MFAIRRVGKTTAQLASITRPAAQFVRCMSHPVQLPPIKNEPVLEYEPGMEEREQLVQALHETRNSTVEVPVVINGKEHYTGKVFKQTMPSDHGTVIAHVHQADEKLIQEAVNAAVAARQEWEMTPWEHRAAVYLKAADLISTSWRPAVMAATMQGQGKNLFQSEIDAAAETIDFYRFGVKYANEIYADQPKEHSPHIWNRLTYRSLEGFIAAISPFNFTAIGANLGATAAMMGNVVVWKPTETATLSNYTVFKALQEAGLPDGVVNFVPADGPTFGKVALASPDLAAVNFTGSTKTFNTLWRGVADNLDHYKTYPRLIGECGGKNFHILHPTAEVDNAVYSTLRSAFEYQGQKCSACSRLYVPKSLWPEFRDQMVEEMKGIKMGQSDDLTVFMSAVIDEKSFNKITGYIEDAKSRGLTLLSGGGSDRSQGWFVEPTFFQASDPHDRMMEEEIFGPVVTAYVYDDDKYSEALKLVDTTSPYGLTGSIFARDRLAIEEGLQTLRHAAGNIYVNAKSTGSVVGQQPFGGARRSGTNDKAGASNFMMRFTSLQSVKECLTKLDDWKYPYMYINEAMETEGDVPYHE